MRVWIDREDGVLELDVEIRGGEPSIGSFLELVRVDTAYLDGLAVDPDGPLRSLLFDGLRLFAAPTTDLPEARWCTVMAGPQAGQRWPLRRGSNDVGRDGPISLDHPTVSRRHCSLILGSAGAKSIEDLGSTNGTEIRGRFVGSRRTIDDDSLIRLGAIVIRTYSSMPDAPPSTPATRAVASRGPFNRPPRAIEPPRPDAPSVPAHATAEAEVTPLSIIRLTMPVLMGLTMAVLFHPRMALFALMSPTMLLATWYANRRRARRENRLTSRAFRFALDRFATEAGRAHDLEHNWMRRIRPDLAETLRRVETGSPHLWERRTGDADFGALVVGMSNRRWEPDLDPDAPAACFEVLEDLGPLTLVPTVVDAAEVIGIVGPRREALSIARSLIVQLAVHHGPADCQIAVVADQEKGRDWEWVTWLPHNRDATAGGTTPLFATTTEAIRDLVDTGDNDGEVRFRWFVVDGTELTREPRSCIRAALSGRHGRAAGVVIAQEAVDLPACCRTIVHVDSSWVGATQRPQEGGGIEEVHLAGLSGSLAADMASRLTRWDDPEVEAPGNGLPDSVRLLDLIDGTQAGIEQRWSSSTHAHSLSAPVGIGDQGVFTIDFVADGPHCLLAGTTGSGKSELLRTMVAALASGYSPEQLNFVLIDYKGGSAFDACAALPHTVGMVTDLDDGLGARALRCLEAELCHREQLLLAAEARDIGDYVDQGELLPRLMVVIDEFATLAAELPDFIDALVDIAQRGRSLGVHLILATQRPAGALKANMKTNTNLRIALRLIDGGDSSDVLDDKAATSIDRRTPGRAFARLGPNELSAFQSALVSGSGPEDDETAIIISPLEAGLPIQRESSATNRPTSDLAQLVEAIDRAWLALDAPEPRRPWPDPLPTHVGHEDLSTDEPGLPIALCDEPSEQRRRVWSWRPETGHLICVGVAGSGPVCALTSIAFAAAKRFDPDRLHIYAIDFGCGALSVLEPLPHCGAVVSHDERERQKRLVAFLVDELRTRKAASATGHPTLLCLIDGWSSLMAEFDGFGGTPIIEGLGRLFSEGAPVGIHLAVSADRPGAISAALTASTPNRLVFTLADRGDYLHFGLRGIDPSDLPHGRCWEASSGLEMQIADEPDLPADATRWGSAERNPPQSISTLPHIVELSNLASEHPHPKNDPAHIEMVIGLAGDTLDPIALALHPGDHALVLGPSRSGRSNTLAVIAAAAESTDRSIKISVLASRRSPLADLVTDATHLAPRDIPSLRETSGRHVVLIDDAEMFDDPDATLSSIIDNAPDGLHIVASTRADRLRSGFRHWTHDMRRSRLAVLLRPDDTDGDLFGVRLDPRLEIPPLPGRGVLISDGSTRTVQVATIDRSRG